MLLQVTTLPVAAAKLMISLAKGASWILMEAKDKANLDRRQESLNALLFNGQLTDNYANNIQLILFINKEAKGFMKFFIGESVAARRSFRKGRDYPRRNRE